MRHRIGGNINTGLGNPEKCLLDNEWSKNESINNLLKKIMDDAIPLYFNEWQGCDFRIIENESETVFVLGYEPAYKFEKLKIIKISSNKSLSYIWTGIAFGFYGSGIRSKYKFYNEYKYNSKFKRFVDRWNDELLEIHNERR